MKLFLVPILFVQFLVMAPVNAQTNMKENLKLFESKEVVPGTISNRTKQSNKDRITGYEIVISITLDSLVDFVNLSKQSKKSFDDVITVYLQHQLARQELELDFSEDEKLVIESFLTSFVWENAVEQARSYKEFIVDNTKDISDFKKVLRFLDFIQKTRNYLTQDLPEPHNAVKMKLDAEFAAYNPIDWIIFSRQPVGLLCWLLAVHTWYATPLKPD